MRRSINASIIHAHLKGKLFSRFSGSESQQHYAFWLIHGYERIGQVLRGVTPQPPFPISQDQRCAVARYLRRALRLSLGRRPRVYIQRSFMLDDTLYSVFEQHTASGFSRQYIKIATLSPRKRIVLPLRGKGRISGNIRIVLQPNRQGVEVHMPYEKPAKHAKHPGDLGLDAGVTEVFASSDGHKYGPGFGKLLERLSEQNNQVGKARNRLYRLAEKAETCGQHKKARHIRRYNLGRKDLDKRRRAGQAEIKRRVGEAVKQALAEAPQRVVVENLSGMRGRTKSRKLSRIVSLWMRSALAQRLEYVAQAGGSRLETVNPAFTSQTCPNPSCGYVDTNNRQGDRFQCLKCGYAGDADVVASMNIAARVDDPEIQLWTPKEKVKEILDARFRRRSEGAVVLTAPGRTPGITCVSGSGKRSGYHVVTESEQYRKP